ncbi:histone-like nucleoid-structuring protein, MvaT/MvaU family [Hahella ganghwensis]|uniref:histone-like nucleoid-structuring protein, MvaT/MvaU family n=1 Tax=Hahella ganghwensis TaxID=286420 RepID=UPI00036B7ED9|nr:histone-like nucleoid-structuring protein, MvaT/MvaU family [Hahella ganghwensis]
MNKLAAYIEAKSEMESLKKRLEALESDESLKQTLKFQTELEKLMDKFGVSRDDVLKMWGKKSDAKSASDKRRGTRPLKTYKNPKTGETVKTRGGNHKTLNAWREEYGKDAVDSWLVK